MNFCFFATASTLKEIWSYVRSRALTPQALRFLRIEYQTEFFVVLILGMFTIALSSFPGLPILLRRQHKAELRSYRLFDPSSRVGR